jgi:hypothetical protein
MNYSWILDSGGAGRGAWQGGVIYEFMRWSLRHDVFPLITMGASAGGYAAADVATGTDHTVMKGWTHWGSPVSSAFSGIKNRFRANLLNSIHYVMGTEELAGVFRKQPPRKLLIFTTRVRRRDGKPFGAIDSLRYFSKSATRKLSAPFKYLPGAYNEEPVIYALNLPGDLRSEYVRPLTRENYHAVIEASCLVPVAMGSPPDPEKINPTPYPGDENAVFIDGGYALKMPLRIFEEDPRFTALADWASADKTIIFCCDPDGYLWETSSRLQALNSLPATARAIEKKRLLVIRPDHKIEAGFLCMDNDVAMRTFTRGRQQAERLLASDAVRRFFDR